jgi:adenosylhomocysteine nucleosidase
MALSMIFDMDGTLFQTDKILEISLDETFQHLNSMNIWGGETPIQKYREIMGVPLPVVWETLLPQHTQEVREQANNFFQNALITNIHTGKGALYPYVEEVLEFLKSSEVHLYIASNGQVEYLNAIVTHYQLDRWISETFSIEQINSQSKGDLVRTIIDKFGIQEGMMIGDRLSDIIAGKQNGLLSIGCRFDFAQEDELAQADMIINSLSELKDLAISKESISMSTSSR